MFIKQMIVGSMSVCCYILACESTGQGMIIDPGGDEDAILAACETGLTVKINQKAKDKICAHKDQAILSKKLATIVTDAPINLDLKKCIVHEYSETKARALFEELGFKSLLKRLPKSMPSSAQGSLFA